MHFRNKKREYLKGKIGELAMHSKNKNIGHLNGGINLFRKCYQLRCNLVKDEISNLLSGSNNI
jgi:hypothetical protein